MNDLREAASAPGRFAVGGDDGPASDFPGASRGSSTRTNKRAGKQTAAGADSPQRSLAFDVERGRAMRDHGMEAAALAHKDVLRHARSVARRLARQSDNAITVDDVMAELQTEGLHPQDLGNAAGSIFKGDPRWVACGYVKSTRPSRHRGVIMSWIYLKPGGAR